MSEYSADLKYKYSPHCATCKYLRFHPKEKLILANINRFNTASAMTMFDFHKLYMPRDVTYASVRNHVLKHISVIKKATMVTIVNEDSPEAKEAEKVEVVESKKEQFERTLDEFINQFDEGLRARKFNLTVKDGLTALKIKADIVGKNKDRKKDILKAMMGVRGEVDETKET